MSGARNFTGTYSFRYLQGGNNQARHLWCSMYLGVRIAIIGVANVSECNWHGPPGATLHKKRVLERIYHLILVRAIGREGSCDSESRS